MSDARLKSFIDRVLRLKEEQDELGKDIRDVYAEAKVEGYDKTIMGKIVSHLRAVEKVGSDAVSEAESVFETYLSAYRRASGMPLATHTHEENYDRETGEINPTLVKQVVDGMQTEAGRAALLTAIDIMIEREEAEEQPETATKQRVNVHSQHEGANAQATVQNECVTVVGTESGTVAKTAADFRPHCLRPDSCGASGLTHCYSCSKQSEQRERDAA